MRVAILKDDSVEVGVLIRWIQAAGHRAQIFSDDLELLGVAQRGQVDVLLLDWKIGHIHGVDLLRRVRHCCSVPVVLTLPIEREQYVTTVLREGAADYLVKPVRRVELLARLEAASRRGSPKAVSAQTIRIEPFEVNCAGRSITRDGIPVDLTTKDFDLAVLFLQNVGRLLPRRHIMETVWPSDRSKTSRTLDTHVSRLRNSLGLTPEFGWRLSAVYRHGYRLDDLNTERSSQSPSSIKRRRSLPEPV
jgi:two-component system, OmpR family, response regulator RegX3